MAKVSDKLGNKLAKTSNSPVNPTFSIVCILLQTSAFFINCVQFTSQVYLCPFWCFGFLLQLLY